MAKVRVLSLCPHFRIAFAITILFALLNAHSVHAQDATAAKTLTGAIENAIQSLVNAPPAGSSSVIAFLRPPLAIPSLYQQQDSLSPDLASLAAPIRVVDRTLIRGNDSNYI